MYLKKINYIFYLIPENEKFYLLRITYLYVNKNEQPIDNIYPNLITFFVLIKKQLRTNSLKLVSKKCFCFISFNTMVSSMFAECQFSWICSHSTMF